MSASRGGDRRVSFRLGVLSLRGESLPETFGIFVLFPCKKKLVIFLPSLLIVFLGAH